MEPKTWIPTHQGEVFSTGFFHRRIHYIDDPEKDSNWVKKTSPLFGGVNSARWRREMEIDWGVYAGERVWPMLSRKYHNAVINLKDWALYRVIDHGIRHPTCCLWVAVNKNGDRHFYREYYATDKSVALNSKSILSLTGEEKIVDTIIDPSTRKRVNYLTSDTTAAKQGFARLVDLYIENGISCSLADNSAAGYDKVTDGLLSQLARCALREGGMPDYLAEMQVTQEHILLLASKPAISFDLRFISRAYNETENLRWKELTGDITQHSEPEKTVDVADEGPDCIRYAMQTDIFWRRPVRLPVNSEAARKQKSHLRRRQKQYARWA